MIEIDSWVLFLSCLLYSFFSEQPAFVSLYIYVLNIKNHEKKFWTEVDFKIVL
jgi:hypothetical protein